MPKQTRFWGDPMLCIAVIAIALSVSCSAASSTSSPSAHLAERQQRPRPTASSAPRAPERWPACEAISEQERWGHVVLDPTARGFKRHSESDHFVLWAAPGAKVRQKSIDIGEAHIRVIESLFQRKFDTKVSWFIYPDRDAVKAATGMKLLIRRDVRQLHLTESRHLHEMVHMMTYYWTGHRSVPLFDEGVAEALGNWSWRPGDSVEKLAIKDWTSEHVHVMTARWKSEGKLPALSAVITNSAFRRWQGPKDVASYVFAASFVLLLIDRFGVDGFFRVLSAICVEDDEKTIEQKLRFTLGESLGSLEQHWLEKLPSLASAHKSGL